MHTWGNRKITKYYVNEAKDIYEYNEVHQTACYYLTIYILELCAGGLIRFNGYHSRW